jgi:(p)ppGpp synthase/HD superfamily hydrolase
VVADKNALAHALNSSIKDLQQGIDRHCVLISSIMANQIELQELKPLLEACPSKARELTLKKAIKDAIDTLEDTRKAFKSKQLEMLRKRLTQVLVDAS